MGGRGGGSSASALGQAQKKAAAPAVPPAAQSQDLVLEAIRQAIATENNRSVTSMERVRERLSAQGLSRDQQDAQILRLFRAREIVLTPVTNQKMMTQAQRDARISVGGELKGFVMIA